MSWPLPDLENPLMKPHWAAAREQRLEMQQCPSCGYIRWPAAEICPECLTEGGEWTTLGGHGTVWSFAVYETSLLPAFERECPYAVALVRLDEGPMMVGRVVDDPAEIACDRRVRLIFAEVAPDVVIPRFCIEDRSDV